MLGDAKSAGSQARAVFFHQSTIALLLIRDREACHHGSEQPFAMAFEYRQQQANHVIPIGPKR